MFMDASQKSAEFQEGVKTCFEAADANKDSLLDKDEYVVFEKKRAEMATARYGEALTFTDDEYKEHYQYANGITPGTEGISFQDLLIANDIYVEIYTAENAQ